MRAGLHPCCTALYASALLQLARLKAKAKWTHSSGSVGHPTLLQRDGGTIKIGRIPIERIQHQALPDAADGNSGVEIAVENAPFARNRAQHKLESPENHNPARNWPKARSTIDHHDA